MKRIAALLTCFNRKNKTISCLKSLFAAELEYNSKESIGDAVDINVYITDDGCTDGTADAIRKTFPGSYITIIQGSGSLFYNGGMILAWNHALKEGEFDFYLLMNDDTDVLDNLFEELFKTHEYCLKNYSVAGIYSGCTTSKENFNKTTYGGTVYINKFLNISKRLDPRGIPQMVDVANANILMVHATVVNKIGIFFDKYIQCLADYDYSLVAKKNKIPVLLTASYCGRCSNDHTFNLDRYSKMSFAERKKMLFSPFGFYAKERLIFIKRHFWYRYPFIAVEMWIKLYFPNLHIILLKFTHALRFEKVETNK